jgi:AmmeMemoRadiSam system protein B
MVTSRVRRPVVEGYFYPADPAVLDEALDVLLGGAPAAPVRAHALIVPHGSFRHAGAVAAAAWAAVCIPRRVVILGPSHTGSWMPWSVMEHGAYRTPLGEVPVDERGVAALRERCPFLAADAWAQQGEHAIEVVLPFLQRLGPPDLAIVPIITGSSDRGEFSRFSEALTQVVRMQEEPVLLVASTDLSHYEPEARSRELDAALLDAIRTLEGDALLRCLREGQITMCGEGAAVCVLDAARALGAISATVTRYATSADAGGDPDSATGYAGVVIT